ncbi:MAG: hypothetical protein SF123_21890 [Chloroflexota bacterium]|nr:hypothetical protein [Chloroflexota bacterium]
MPQHIIRERDYSLFWLDKAETILVLEISGQWKWRTAGAVLDRLCDVLAADPEKHIYLLFHFFRSNASLPDKYAAPQLQRLLSPQIANGRVIIVIDEMMLYRTLQTVGKLGHVTAERLVQIRFTKSLGDALKIIARDKQLISTA